MGSFWETVCVKKCPNGKSKTLECAVNSAIKTCKGKDYPVSKIKKDENIIFAGEKFHIYKFTNPKRIVKVHRKTENYPLIYKTRACEIFLLLKKKNLKK